jgi:hypothetical protein
LKVVADHVGADEGVGKWCHLLEATVRILSCYYFDQ